MAHDGRTRLPRSKLPVRPWRISFSFDSMGLTVPTDQPTLEAALGAASEDDTITVLPGAYVLKEALRLSVSCEIVGGVASDVVVEGFKVIPLRSRAESIPFIAD